jgi:hypothetical protein
MRRARPDRSPAKTGPPERRPADMDEDYKGHHIQSVPRHLLPDSERWTAQVLINWTDGRRKQFRRFDVKRGFATEEEAELAGLTFARKWIDDGKPKLRESGTGGGS